MPGFKNRSNDHRRIAVLACALLTPLHVTSIAKAEADPCDPELLQLGKGNPGGYQRRGDRCEGIYVQEVAGSSTLQLSSLIESFAQDVDFLHTTGLTIEWDGRIDRPVRIRATSLRPKRYYRMDTVVDRGKSSYMWPTDVLRAREMDKAELGVCASTEMNVGADRRTVQLPVRIRGLESPSSSHNPRRYSVVLISELELSELYYSLVELKPDGTPSRVLVKDKALALGYYPPQRGIPIWLPELTTPAVYRLDVAAVLRRGGSSTRQIWFYHSGS